MRYINIACWVCLIHHKQTKLQCNIFCLFSGEALNCNYCYSNKSWSDCDRNSIQSHCDTEIGKDATCIKVYRLVKDGDKEINHYFKSCLPSKHCSGEECVELGQFCRIDCCNTDACNGSVFLNENYMTFLTLAFVIIAYLLWSVWNCFKETFQSFSKFFTALFQD